MNKAIILFSGGLDSTTCLAIAKSLNFECYTLSIHYGQKHDAELQAAEVISRKLGAIQHYQFSIPKIQGSALTETHLAVPDYKDSTDIPITYVPARNTIFLSLALSLTEMLDAYDIFVGVNAVDYSNYPDCRPEYIECFQKLMHLATKAGVEEGQEFKIHTPLIHLSKAEIIQKGHALGVDYSMTVTCYQADPEGHACGRCDACALRRKGFLEAGVADPTLYTVFPSPAIAGEG